eukprot:COSAG04_NODE_3040_length_3246_cov_2.669844_5_plen_316_part_01
MMHQSVKSTEQAITAADSVELHSVLLEVLKIQTNVGQPDDAATPPAARDPHVNVAVCRACWRDRLFSRLEVQLPHDLPLTVFEDKLLVMRAGSAQIQAEGDSRKTQYVRDFLLSTAQGGQYETSEIDAAKESIRYQKVRLTPLATNDLTAKQLQKKVKDLEAAAAEREMVGEDRLGPHQLTAFTPKGRGFLGKFQKSGSVSKAKYRENVMQVDPSLLQARGSFALEPSTQQLTPLPDAGLSCDGRDHCVQRGSGSGRSHRLAGGDSPALLRWGAPAEAGTAITEVNAGSRFGKARDTAAWAIELGNFTGTVQLAQG